MISSEIQLYSEEDQMFYDIEFNTVDNGGKYPGSFTKFEIDKIIEKMFGNVLHLFSGSSTIGNVRVDLSNKNATLNCDVFDYLEVCNDTFDTIILDPPYNKRYAEKYAKLSNTDVSRQFVIFAQAKKTTQFFNLIRELSPQRIIMKSWNWYIVKDYIKNSCVLCYAGGYRKPTLLMILDRS